MAGDLSFYELERGTEADALPQNGKRWHGSMKSCWNREQNSIWLLPVSLKSTKRIRSSGLRKAHGSQKAMWSGRRFCRISATGRFQDVITWQNELMAYRDERGKPYSADYLKTIHAQLTAIFNHAVNFYNLPYNPARRAGTMGNEIPKEMDFWTKEEYLKFSEAMMDNGAVSVPANYWRSLLPTLILRIRRSRSVRLITAQKGGILSQALRLQRVTGL